MKLVILESPFAGDIAANRAYAHKAMKHSLSVGEAPMLSHLLYTQVLNDDDLDDRTLGIAAGHAWLSVVDRSILYMDRGLSPGMKQGIENALKANVPIDARWFGPPLYFDEVEAYIEGCQTYIDGRPCP